MVHLTNPTRRSSGDAEGVINGSVHGGVATGDAGIARCTASGEKRRNLSSSSTHRETSSGSSSEGNKSVRQDWGDMLVAPTPAGSAVGGSPTLAGYGSISEPDGATVKMETGFFEGRPRGSFQSRRRPSRR